ncbi:MAG: PEGA domain-containing protein [Deltaproteobacteria bacterium]|nr:PEGA domain-containing protein [Deltaproteobacteria bacterium]
MRPPAGLVYMPKDVPRRGPSCIPQTFGLLVAASDPGAEVGATSLHFLARDWLTGLSHRVLDEDYASDQQLGDRQQDAARLLDSGRQHYHKLALDAAQRDLDRAAAVLEPCLPAMQQLGMEPWLEVQLLRASIHYHQGRFDEAAGVIQTMLLFGDPSGFAERKANLVSTLFRQFVGELQSPGGEALAVCQERARRALKTGIDRYDELELEKAVSHLFRAARELMPCLPRMQRAGKMDLWLEIHLYLATAWHLMGEDRRAATAFRQMAPYDGRSFVAARSGISVPPDVLKLYDESVAAGPQRGPRRSGPEEGAEPISSGELLVRSTPEGAFIQIDGVEVGTSPKQLDVSALGWHYVSLWKDGHVPTGRFVLIEDERRVEVSLALRPSPLSHLRAALARARGMDGIVEVADELARRWDVPWVLLVQVGARGAAVSFEAFLYDRGGHRCLSSGERHVDTGRQSPDAELIRSFEDLLAKAAIAAGA